MRWTLKTCLEKSPTQGVENKKISDMLLGAHPVWSTPCTHLTINETSPLKSLIEFYEYLLVYKIFLLFFCCFAFRTFLCTFFISRHLKVIGLFVKKKKKRKEKGEEKKKRRRKREKPQTRGKTKKRWFYLRKKKLADCWRTTKRESNKEVKNVGSWKGSLVHKGHRVSLENGKTRTKWRRRGSFATEIGE